MVCLIHQIPGQSSSNSQAGIVMAPLVLYLILTVYLIFTDNPATSIFPVQQSSILKDLQRSHRCRVFFYIPHITEIVMNNCHKLG